MRYWKNKGLRIYFLLVLGCTALGMLPQYLAYLIVNTFTIALINISFPFLGPPMIVWKQIVFSESSKSLLNGYLTGTANTLTSLTVVTTIYYAFLFSPAAAALIVSDREHVQFWDRKFWLVLQSVYLAIHLLLALIVLHGMSQIRA